jgi:hypothetical protein
MLGTIPSAEQVLSTAEGRGGGAARHTHLGCDAGSAARCVSGRRRGPEAQEGHPEAVIGGEDAPGAADGGLVGSAGFARRRRRRGG